MKLPDSNTKNRNINPEIKQNQAGFKNKKKLSPKVKRNRALAIGLLVLIIAGFFINRAYENYKIKKTIQLNLEIVKAMELRNVSEIEGKLKELREKYGIGRIDTDSISNRRYFEDSLFMGDSLTEPLSLYEYLPKSNVLAVKGRNTKTALDDVKQITNLNPSRIFLSYGMNDLNITNDPDVFKSNYSDLIKAIKKIKPDAEIVLLSIQYATDSAVAAQPTLSDKRVDEFNGKMKALAEENNYYYLDISSLVKGSNLYEGDGIHFATSYYSKLLNLIKSEFINRS
ncbi:MAG: GDSL-type esterase/lipase family protein [Clostridiaceae bacterium]